MRQERRDAAGARIRGRLCRALLAGAFASALALAAGSARALEAPDQEQEPPPAPPPKEWAPAKMPDDFDASEAAHPVRIVAYALHPVGVALEWIVVRPAFWVVRHEPFRTIFGYQD